MPDQASKLHQLCDEQANSGSACLPFLYIPVTPTGTPISYSRPPLSPTAHQSAQQTAEATSALVKATTRTASTGTQRCTCTTAGFQGLASVALVPSLLPVHA